MQRFARGKFIELWTQTWPALHDKMVLQTIYLFTINSVLTAYNSCLGLLPLLFYLICIFNCFNLFLTLHPCCVRSILSQSISIFRIYLSFYSRSTNLTSLDNGYKLETSCILYTLFKVQFTLLYLVVFIEITVHHASTKIVPANCFSMYTQLDKKCSKRIENF